MESGYEVGKREGRDEPSTSTYPLVLPAHHPPTYPPTHLPTYPPTPFIHPRSTNPSCVSSGCIFSELRSCLTFNYFGGFLHRLNRRRNSLRDAPTAHRGAAFPRAPLRQAFNACFIPATEEGVRYCALFRSIQRNGVPAPLA